MIGEHTSRGWEIRFRSRGPARFLGAGFLGFWLCGWAAGECFALWMIARGPISLLSGQLPTSGGAPLSPGAAGGIGLFLLVWVSFWTLGGVLAIRELLRLLWSEDHLTVHGGGLVVERTVGPFRSTREIARDAIRDVVLVPHRGRFVVRTDHGTVELTRLGSPDEREQAALALRNELGLTSAAVVTTKLPKEWEEVVTAEGERAVTPATRTRRVQARVATIAAMLFASVAFLLVREATVRVGLVPVAVFMLAATAGITCGAVWLARGRMEWRIGSGRLILRRRFGANVRDVFEARRLELSTTSDSDGDDWFHLDALASAEPEPSSPLHHGAQRGSRTRRRIVSVMNDPALPRQLGAWLASAADLTLDDATTAAARAVELARLRDQLEKSGALGRIAARFIGRLAAQRGSRAS